MTAKPEPHAITVWRCELWNLNGQRRLGPQSLIEAPRRGPQRSVRAEDARSLPPGPTTARCSRRHLPPQPGCECGVYAVSTLESLEVVALGFERYLDRLGSYRLAIIRGALSHALVHRERNDIDADKYRRAMLSPFHSFKGFPDPSGTVRGRTFTPEWAIVQTAGELESASDFNQMPGAPVQVHRGGYWVAGERPRIGLSGLLWLHRQRDRLGNWWDASAEHADGCTSPLTYRHLPGVRIGTCSCGAHGYEEVRS